MAVPSCPGLEGYGYCIPTPKAVCTPDPDLGGTRKAGHVPGVPVATGPVPVEQLLQLKDLVGQDVLGVPHWPGLHIVVSIAAE